MIGLCGAAASACAADNGAEDADIATVEQDWSVGSCGAVAANYSDTGSFSPLHKSPGNYNTCTKSYVADLWYPSSSGVGTYIGGDWSAMTPLDPTECAKLFVGVIKYERSGGIWIHKTTEKVFGIWHPASGNTGAYCQKPIWSEFLWSGTTYPSRRFAITARTSDSSSAPVVPIIISSCSACM